MSLINCLYKWLVFMILTFLPVFVNAALPEWEIIPGESSLSFTATQNDAPVKGQFKQFTGKIFVDPNNYKSSKIDIIVDMNSVSADYADVKNTLITPDFFNVQMFPKAEFKATEFNKTGDKTYQAMGTLTIRDKSAPVTLTFTAVETSPGMALVEGTTTFKRSTFGVGQGDWASTDEIKDDVKVDFKLVAKKKS
ncbi:putative YceI-like family protein [Legionella donaldsonii]|uniref:Putative YceI-like family protein n=1 Tax=Legionella donaldsonii TaxID=45060 RepID=A0A378J1D3_9GAMM|nr:YceI family protein [Legionella donaldsonii]STX41088.1 putative YceI-like family protein [Legionella donaldsonii]